MALQKRYRIIHTARLILEQNGEVLFLAQTKQNGNGFSLPGGKVQGVEFAKDGLIRETKEEIGIELKKKQLRLQHVTYKKLKSSIEIIFFFYTDILHGIPTICEPDKFKEIKWFLPKDYPEKMPIVIKETLLRIHDGKNYTEFPKSKKLKNQSIKTDANESGLPNVEKKKKKTTQVKVEKKIENPSLSELEFNKIIQNKKKKKTQNKKKTEAKNKKENISEHPMTQTI